MTNRLGYDTRSLRSALVMAAVDALRPWRREKPFAWGESIVVSSVAGLGDLFIHLPLIAGIVAACRQRGLAVRVALRPAFAEIGRRCGWDVLLFDNALEEFFKAPGKIRPGEVFASVREARQSAPEVWIDLTANALNAMLIKLGGADRLAARITRGGRSFTDHFLPHTIGESEYGNCARVAAHLGCTLDPAVFQSLAEPSPYPGEVVLSITTACRWRNWPLQNFLEIVRAFPARRFATIGFEREIAPEERPIFSELAAQPNVRNLLDRLSLFDLIALLANAPAVVTNDTSSAHIAQAYGRPGAVIFGPTPEAFLPHPWPSSEPSSLRVFHDRSCPFYPCTQWKCEIPSRWCMTLVPATAVIEHLRALTT